MEATNYKSIGPVLQLNKAGELTQKRMKAVKVCDGLYISEPDKNGYMQFICELNDVIWLDCKAAETKIAYGIKRIPSYFKDIKAGCFDGKNIEKFRREISRRINRPDSPVIMELKKPERKKPEPLPEGAKKASVYMCKGCTDETTDKKVVITEIAPHVYKYVYKLKKYGERVKIIFEIDGVYFQGHDTGMYVLEREDFTEVCTKAYASARKNVAGGAAQGMPYFVEVQKRIDAATPTEMPQISTETAETVNVSAEGENAENEPIKHISEIMETCRTWDDEKRDYTDEYKYYTWLANHIPEHKATNKNTTELILEKVRERISAAATLAAHGVPKCDIEGAVCAVVNRLAKMEDVLQFCNHKEPPQSPGTPQAAECIADTPNPRETAREPQNRGIGSTRHSRLGANGYTMLDNASATLTAMSVPRECSTADYW